MTESEAYEIVERYEALLRTVAPARQWDEHRLTVADGEIRLLRTCDVLADSGEVEVAFTPSWF